MKQRWRFWPVAGLVSFVLAGCDWPQADDSAVEIRGAEPGAAVAPTRPPPAFPTGLAEWIPEDTVRGALTLGRTPVLGPFIADDRGRALYMFTEDRPGTSNCYAGCAEKWQPFLAPAGNPRAAAKGVAQGSIGLIQRQNGANQVTFGGHPLYYFYGDAGPGQAAGHGVRAFGGTWYLVGRDSGRLD